MANQLVMPLSNKIKPVQAAWTSPHSGLITLSCDWTQAVHPPLSLKCNRVRSLHPVPARCFGEKSGYFRDGRECVFLWHTPYYPNYCSKGCDVFVAGAFNDWRPHPEWQLKQENATDWCLRVPINKLGRARELPFKFFISNGTWVEPSNLSPNVVSNEHHSRNLLYIPTQTGRHLWGFETEEACDCFAPEWVQWQQGTAQGMAIPMDFSEWLLSRFSDCPLGASIEGERTIFGLFAPRATRVSVSFSNSLKGPSETLDLVPQVDGAWIGSYPSNLHGYYYHFYVDGDPQSPGTHFDPSMPILDPYAWATVGRGGPGIIIDRQRLARPEHRFEPPQWQDLLVVECHIRDLLANTGQVGDFSGLKKWLASPECYLRQLGANAVELQPIQEFDAGSKEEYHWGYMPVNYFSPASSYASDPNRGNQIEECQALIRTFHDAGIAVILDVVYNHIGNPNPLLSIDKRYYFETTANGELTNWSGCGNDLRTNTPMGQRLILDSLKHWVSYYDVDGFRFDLADLVGLETLKVIERELKKIKPSIVLIAEPWSFRGHIGFALKETGFASWNDGYRDFVGNYVRGNGNQEGLRYFLGGSLAHLSRFPAQSVNYAASHDDHCWLDKITECASHNASWPTQGDRRRTHLMISILMASIGIPMLSQGVDLLHSKQGVNNTYLRGDLNALDYKRALLFPNTCEYVRRWIAFRCSSYGQVWRLAHCPTSQFLRFWGAQNASALAVLYNADNSLPTPPVLFAINPHATPVTIRLDGLSPKDFLCVADAERFDVTGLETLRPQWQNSELLIPPMGCYLWRHS